MSMSTEIGYYKEAEFDLFKPKKTEFEYYCRECGGYTRAYNFKAEKCEDCGSEDLEEI